MFQYISYSVKYLLYFVLFLSLSFVLGLSGDAIAQTSNINFELYPIRSFQTTGRVIDIASADFNGDGKTDVVVADPGWSTVSVLLNQTNSEGIFLSEPIAFGVGWEPWSLVAGDFDGDGKSDIITANQGTEDITILRNVSTLDSVDFAVSVGCSLRRLPRSLLSADFDGDGKLDLAVFNAWSDTISVLRNMSERGQIKFKIEIEIRLVSTAESIVAADFDSDGKIDLAIHSSGIEVFRNISQGEHINFAEPASFSFDGGELTTSDFDNDGKVDIAGIGWGRVWLIRNKSTVGNLDFEQRWKEWQWNLEAYSTSIWACDLNNDERMDIVLTSPDIIGADPQEHNCITVLTNMSTSGSFNFAPNLSLGVMGDPQAVTSADFDTDGKTDLALGSGQGLAVSILHNMSDLSEIRLDIASKFNVSAGAWSIVGADFDSDGKQDLLIKGKESFSLLRNISGIGKASFAPPVECFSLKNTHEAVASDFDGDGKPDILVTKTRGVSVFRNISTLSNVQMAFVDSIHGSHDHLSIAIADFDGDKKQDFVVGCSKVINSTVYDSVFIFRNVTSIGHIKFSEPIVISDADRPESIVANDFDGDGRIDLAVANNFYGEIVMFHNESSVGNIAFSRQYVEYGTLWGPDVLASGDFDGDGKLDLAVLYSGEVATLRNISTVGNIRFASPVKIDYRAYPISNFNSYRWMSCSELTGDGKPDLLIGNQLAQFFVLENRSSIGSINFAPAFPGTIILSDRNYFIADLDGDGGNDIAGVRSDQNEVCLLRTSTTPFPTSVTIPLKCIPKGYELSQNCPNPFNPNTDICYQLPEACHVTLKIYNLLGQEIRILVNQRHIAGNYTAHWDGRDVQGQNLASRIYLYRIEAGSFVASRKLTIIR